MKFNIWAFKKVQVSLQSVKINRHFTWRPIYIFLLHLAHFFLDWEMFQTKVVEKIKTDILCSVNYFIVRKSCRLWDNVEITLYNQTGHRRQYGACALHAGYLRLQTHTLLSHTNNGCTNAPQCYVMRKLIVLYYISLVRFLYRLSSCFVWSC